MTPTMLAKILSPRTEVSPGGLVVVSECIECHVEADGVVWVLRRGYIGCTPYGLEIDCAIVDGDTWVIEKEATGFSHYECPVEWLKRTKVKDWDWRDAVWEHAEEALARDVDDV